MNLRSILLIGCLCLLAGVLLHAQGMSEDEVVWGSRPYFPVGTNAVTLQSNLVQVPVLVRDSQGKLVDGLQKDDFEAYDNGRKQTISLFSIERAPHAPPVQPVSVSAPVANAPINVPTPAPPPRYVAFYFDDTNSPLGDLVTAREAARKYVRESLQPGDLVGVFTTSTTVSLNFTDNRQALEKTLARLLTHWKRPSSVCPKMRPYQASVIDKLYNVRSDELSLAMAECPQCNGDFHCVMNAATETLAMSEQYSQDTMGIINDVTRYLGRMPGKRMLLLTSSGFMTETLKPQLDKVIAAAIYNKVVINSLDAKGLVPDGDFDYSDGPPVAIAGRLAAVRDLIMSAQRETYNDPLFQLAEGTGGKFFHNSNDLGRGIRELTAVPEVSYVIGFSPVNLSANGSVHSLKVKVPGHPDVKIEARPQYYAPSPGLSANEKKLRALNREVVAVETRGEIPAVITTEPGMLANGKPVLKVLVHVDISKLPFQKMGDRNVERLIFVTALFDTNNKFLTGVQGVMDLRLKNPTLSNLSTQGMDAKLSLDMPAGTYRLRQVMQETWSGRVTAISRAVEIR